MKVADVFPNDVLRIIVSIVYANPISTLILLSMRREWQNYFYIDENYGRH